MLKKLIALLFLITLILVFSGCSGGNQESSVDDTQQADLPPVETPIYESNNATGEIIIKTIDSQQVYILPPYTTDGNISVESALATRRSRRSFQDKALTASQLSQILWAAYGITLPDSPHFRVGLRTTPSAGATYPLEIYAIIGNVEGIEPGVFRYIAEEHKLIRVIDGDIRTELSEAALRQRMVREAPVSIFYSAVFSRITGIYGARGIRYAYIELGHSAQNVYLQVEALGLGTVAIGAFHDSAVRRILNLPDDEEPLYIMPIGYVYGD